MSVWHIVPIVLAVGSAAFLVAAWWLRSGAEHFDPVDWEDAPTVWRPAEWED